MGVVPAGSRLTPRRLSIPCGVVSVSMNAQTVLDVSVAYGFTFDAPPRVGAIISGSASTAADVRTINPTTTGFTLRVFGINGAAVTLTGVAVTWWAIPA